MLRVGDKPLELLRHVRGLTLLDLPDAESCCGFGGTFALKNADTSTAMLADKMAHVMESGAEICSAGDSSCLMHIGGAEPHPVRGPHRAPRRDLGIHRRRGRGCAVSTFLGTPGTGNLRGDESFPRAARKTLRDTQMRRNVGHATRTIRAKRLNAVSECADWEEPARRAARSNRMCWRGSPNCSRSSSAT